MGKSDSPSEIFNRNVGCLENLVVAYNTIFLMSSIFIISIASSVSHLFYDIETYISPSMLLLVVGGFICLTALAGYIGVAKKSSTLVGVYTIILICIFVLELSAGIGIMSFRGKIKSAISHRMKTAIVSYPDDLMTANMVDFVQLELSCCGGNNYWDWDGVFDEQYVSNCKAVDIVLPPTCCVKSGNLTLVKKRGCLPTLNLQMHRSALFLITGLTAICTVQILGAYFSYSLSTILHKLKMNKLLSPNKIPRDNEQIIIETREKANYF